MATVIRMKRGGRKHAPYYRMVVVDSRSRTLGREVDLIGYYHPCARPEPKVEVDADKALHWLSSGARPSDTVRDILSKKGIMAALAAGVKTMTPAPVAAPAPEVEEAVEEAEAAPVEDAAGTQTTGAEATVESVTE